MTETSGLPGLDACANRRTMMKTTLASVGGIAAALCLLPGVGAAAALPKSSATTATFSVSVPDFTAYQGAPNVQISAKVDSSDGSAVNQGQVRFKIVNPLSRYHLGFNLVASVTNGVATVSLSVPYNQKTGIYIITAYYVASSGQAVGASSPSGVGSLNVISQV